MQSYGIVQSVTKATVMAMLPTGITVLRRAIWDSAKCDKSYGHGYVTDRFIVVWIWQLIQLLLMQNVLF